MNFTLWQKSLVFSLILNIAAVGMTGLAFNIGQNNQPLAEITVDLSVPTDNNARQMTETFKQVDNVVSPINPGQAASSSDRYSPDAARQEISAVSDNGTNSYAEPQRGNTTATNLAIAQNVSAAPQLGSKGISPPKLLHKVEPRYPENARLQGIYGTVKVKALISTEGTVGECFVTFSSGYHELDTAALEAVRMWQFSPAVDKATGQCINSYISLPVVFTFD